MNFPARPTMVSARKKLEDDAWVVGQTVFINGSLHGQRSRC